MSSLYYFHGLESSPSGFRAQYLKERYPEILIPKLPKDAEQRHQILTGLLKPDAYIIGSSLGGLSALICAKHFPERIRGMVLLAPAVGFFEARYRTAENLNFVASLTIPETIPTTILAATEDEVIPMEAIEALVARSGKGHHLRLHKLEDEHRMRRAATLLAMTNAVDAMLAREQKG